MTTNPVVNVLLVEDDIRAARHIEGIMAGAAPFVVQRARDLETAERMLEQVPFHIILLSLDLTEPAGLGALALLQAMAPRLPIVVLASDDGETLALKAVHQGAADYLIRSHIFPTVLVRSLKHAIEFRRTEELKEQYERALKWERDFNSALVDTAGCLFIVLDRYGRIVEFNHTCETISGLQASSVRGRPMWDVLVPESERMAARGAFEQVFQDGSKTHHYENHWRAQDGALHLISWSSTVLRDGAGDPEFMIGTGIEITEQRRAQAAVQHSELRYRALFEQSRDAIFLTDARGIVIETNQAMRDLLKCGVGDLEGASIDTIYADAPDRMLFQQEYAAKREISDFEVRIRRKDGRLLWCLLSMTERADGDGLAPGYQGIIHDITDRKQSEQRLLYNAYHDILTGLPNRALFIDRLDRALVRWHRHREDRFAVMFIDLNRFKVVNDSLGHSAGDELLRQIGNIIVQCVREEDTVARLGGDEYAILLERIETKADPLLIAQRIHGCLSEPLEIAGQALYMSCSIGIALPENDADRAEDLLRNADIAMYKSKAAGPATHTIYIPGMHSLARSLMELDMDLHQAVREREFLLHYQPIYDVVSGVVSGFEALLRWQHPRRGLLLPHEFVPLAEETGLIVPIGNWVIDQVCSQIAEWQALFPSSTLPFVSLNVAGSQITKPDFVRDIARVLRERDVAPEALMFELTETSLLQNPESCAHTITKLRSVGVRFCIDDFGTGYSSLSYLHRLPINGLKIDRSFIAALDRTDGTALVSTIVTLAHSLGLYAVAEGVETASQFSSVQQLGPRYVQGYYFSHPVEAAAAQRMLISA